MKEVIWKPGHGSRDLKSCPTILVIALILFSRFFSSNLNLPEIGSERYFFSWRESTRLFLKSQGRVPRTEMNQKNSLCEVGRQRVKTAKSARGKADVQALSLVRQLGHVDVDKHPCAVLMIFVLQMVSMSLGNGMALPSSSSPSIQPDAASRTMASSRAEIAELTLGPYPSPPQRFALMGNSAEVVKL